MVFKIEEGKFYRTRDGRKVGPMQEKEKCLERFKWCGAWEDGDSSYWTENGLWRYGGTSKYDLINEWAEAPKLWGDMTPEEKGALLLAQLEEKEIEVYSAIYSEWAEKIDYGWRQDLAYRVRPEPKRETVTLWVHYKGKDVPVGKVDLLDGKPDLDSLVM